MTAIDGMFYVFTRFGEKSVKISSFRVFTVFDSFARLIDVYGGILTVFTGI